VGLLLFLPLAGPSSPFLSCPFLRFCAITLLFAHTSRPAPMAAGCSGTAMKGGVGGALTELAAGFCFIIFFSSLSSFLFFVLLPCPFSSRLSSSAYDGLRRALGVAETLFRKCQSSGLCRFPFQSAGPSLPCPSVLFLMSPAFSPARVHFLQFQPTIKRLRFVFFSSFPFLASILSISGTVHQPLFSRSTQYVLSGSTQTNMTRPFSWGWLNGALYIFI